MSPLLHSLRAHLDFVTSRQKQQILTEKHQATVHVTIFK